MQLMLQSWRRNLNMCAARGPLDSSSWLNGWIKCGRRWGCWCALWYQEVDMFLARTSERNQKHVIGKKLNHEKLNSGSWECGVPMLQRSILRRWEVSILYSEMETSIPELNFQAAMALIFEIAEFPNGNLDEEMWNRKKAQRRLRYLMYTPSHVVCTMT